MTMTEMERDDRSVNSLDGSGAAQNFVRRFAQFWSAPSPDAVPVYLRPDVVIHWPGFPAFTGKEYPAFVTRILGLMPDLRLNVTESASASDFVFIAWSARATIGGEIRRWRGIDRFRLRDGEAVDAFVAYDSLPLQTALAQANPAAAVGVAKPEATNEERPRINAVFERYADAKNRHDLDAILELHAEDAYYESIGMGGRVEGKSALRSFYAALFDSLPDYWGRFDDVIVGDGRVVARGRFGGTLSGKLLGLPGEAGAKIEIPVTFVCSLRDGLLTSETGYFDAATLYAQARVQRGALQGGSEFVERFKAFWAAPSGAKVPDLIVPEATVYWPGVAPLTGKTFPAHMDAMLKLVPDMKLDVVDYALTGDLLFILWRARAVVGTHTLSFDGIDRFRLKNGRAIEEVISFDTQPLREALLAASV
jgi:steroid delta-isomerase-like uncharacterized protein